MFRVRIRRPSQPGSLAVATGRTWEEAAFAGYDQLVRRAGGARRYLAKVVQDVAPWSKIVRFGYRTRSRSVKTDPPVAVDIERLG